MSLQQLRLPHVTVSDAGRLASVGQKADNLHHIFRSKCSGAKGCAGACVVGSRTLALTLPEIRVLGHFEFQQSGATERLQRWCAIDAPSVLVFPFKIVEAFAFGVFSKVRRAAGVADVMDSAVSSGGVE